MAAPESEELAREPVAREPFLKVAWTSGALSVVPVMLLYICGVSLLMLVWVPA